MYTVRERGEGWVGGREEVRDGERAREMYYVTLCMMM
jgi:hypothetical protein